MRRYSWRRLHHHRPSGACSCSFAASVFTCSHRTAGEHRPVSDSITESLGVGHIESIHTGDVCRGIVLAAVLDLFTREIDVHELPRPLDVPGPRRRYQHGAATDPIAGVDEQIPNRPRAVVDHTVVDVADLAV